MEPILTNFTTWAKLREDVRAVLLGVPDRRSGTTLAPQVFSLRIFCLDPDLLIRAPGWLEALGEVWTWQTAEGRDGNPVLQVLFGGGQSLDLIFHTSAEPGGPVEDALRPGNLPLIDKDGVFVQRPNPFGSDEWDQIPTETLFRKIVRSFYFEAGAVGIHLVHENCWAVALHNRLAGGHLENIRRWHTLALQGGDSLDGIENKRPSHEGISWPALIAGQDRREDHWRDLFQTIETFRRLAQEAALRFGYEYPAGLDSRIMGWLTALRQLPPER